MKKILLFISLFSFALVSAQETKIKFGKIDPADLSMKVYEEDTNAIAVILNKIGHVKYDPLASEYPLSTEIYVCLKFLKEPALDAYGNISLDYYSYDDASKINNLKAIVHLPDGTDVKVENNMIINDQLNDYYSVKKIALPRLVPGAVVEYQYVVQSKNMFNPVDWFFQSELPIQYTELTTSIPEWYEYVVLTQGSPLFQNSKKAENQKVNFTQTERTTSRYVTSSNIVQNEVDVVFNKYYFVNKNVPALKEESFITSMENYYSRIRFQLNVVKFPNSSRESILNTWEKVAEELYNNEDWGGQLKNKHPGELVLEAAGISETSTASQAEKAQSIYNYINSHVQWNGRYAYGSNYDIASILKAGSANSGNLNKLMCAALLQAGIPAKPVLISTRANGTMFELYPFVDQFNHMIVLATLDGKDTWIDAGDKNRPIGMLRAESLNGRGWIVDKLNPAWTDITPLDSKTVYLIKASLDADGNLTGDLEARFTGYHAFKHRNAIQDDKDTYQRDLLICNSFPVKISGMELINADNATLPLQWKAKIAHPAAIATPDHIYFSHVFPDGLDENPFKLEFRTYPIEMNYPVEVTMITDLSIPEGFKVESLPQPIRYVTEDGGMTISYSMASNGNKLTINMKYAVKQLTYPSEAYAALKTFYDQRKIKFNEQIVLVKA
jgi:hypothetical protein